jgi:hypothetical protein
LKKIVSTRGGNSLRKWTSQWCYTFVAASPTRRILNVLAAHLP